MMNRPAAQINYAASQVIHRDIYALINTAVCKHANRFDSRFLTRLVNANISSFQVHSLDTITRIVQDAAIQASNGAQPMDEATAQNIARGILAGI